MSGYVAFTELSAGNSWLSQAKIIGHHHNHSSTELVHRLKVDSLAHSQVHIIEITNHSIGKHTNSYGTLLIKAKS
jgi:hypothetical protein